MGASKVVDLGEIKRWYDEGWSYREMSDEYLRKYNLQMGQSAFGNIATRQGWEPRIVRDPALIPWRMLPEHQHSYPVQMLRAEARRRAGFPLRDIEEKNLTAWLKGLEDRDEVVHYDPELDAGFVLVPRDPKDADIIRAPSKRKPRSVE